MRGLKKYKYINSEKSTAQISVSSYSATLTVHDKDGNLICDKVFKTQNGAQTAMKKLGEWTAVEEPKRGKARPELD